jgi:hypothetical protein
MSKHPLLQKEFGSTEYAFELLLVQSSLYNLTSLQKDQVLQRFHRHFVRLNGKQHNAGASLLGTQAPPLDRYQRLVDIGYEKRNPMVVLQG